MQCIDARCQTDIRTQARISMLSLRCCLLDEQQQQQQQQQQQLTNKRIAPAKASATATIPCIPTLCRETNSAGSTHRNTASTKAIGSSKNLGLILCKPAHIHVPERTICAPRTSSHMSNANPWITGGWICVASPNVVYIKNVNTVAKASLIPRLLLVVSLAVTIRII